MDSGGASRGTPVACARRSEQIRRGRAVTGCCNSGDPNIDVEVSAILQKNWLMTYVLADRCSSPIRCLRIPPTNNDGKLVAFAPKQQIATGEAVFDLSRNMMQNVVAGLAPVQGVNAV